MSTDAIVCRAQMYLDHLRDFGTQPDGETEQCVLALIGEVERLEEENMQLRTGSPIPTEQSDRKSHHGLELTGNATSCNCLATTESSQRTFAPSDPSP